MEEALIKEIETTIKRMEKTHNYRELKAVKEDLKFLNISLVNIKNPEEKKKLQQRVIDCENKVSLLNEKLPSSLSKATLFNPKQDSLEILQQAQQDLATAEEDGVTILRELDKQKETIKRSKEKLAKIDSKLEKSDGLLNQMSKWWRG
jgi:DNA repair exonuclease SbcCD ATPase subunit